MNKKMSLALLTISLALIFSAYTALAVDPAPTFCEIVNVTAPIFADTGEGIEIDLRYTNLGETGPTFIRLISPIGNLYSFIDVNAHQTEDATKGLYMYLTMPGENVVYQIEVGKGTARSPVEVTDTDLLVILNPSCPPPDMNTVEIQFETIYPIMMFPWVVLLGGYPGQTVAATLYCKSIMENATTYDISYSISTNADLGLVSTEWTIDTNTEDDVDGVTWVPSQSWSLSGGQIHELELTLIIPVDGPMMDYNFWVYPIRTGID